MHKSIVFILLTLVTLVACNSRQEKMLCKTWQVSDVRFANIDEAMPQGDSVSDEEQRVRIMLIKEALMKNVYTFDEDGSYRTGNAAATSEGRWSLSGNNIVFKSTDKNIAEKKFKLGHLSDDSLVINMGNDQTSISVELLLTPLIKY